MVFVSSFLKQKSIRKPERETREFWEPSEPEIAALLFKTRLRLHLPVPLRARYGNKQNLCHAPICFTKTCSGVLRGVRKCWGHFSDRLNGESWSFSPKTASPPPTHKQLWVLSVPEGIPADGRAIVADSRVFRSDSVGSWWIVSALFMWILFCPYGFQMKKHAIVLEAGTTSTLNKTLTASTVFEMSSSHRSNGCFMPICPFGTAPRTLRCVHLRLIHK